GKRVIPQPKWGISKFSGGEKQELARETIPSLPAVISSLSEESAVLNEQQQSAVNYLLQELSERVPEAVANDLLNRAIPPELFAILREGLLETFVKIRRVLVSASTVPELAEQMENAARKILLDYFRSIRQLVQDVMSLSTDVMRNLEVLAIITSAKDLSVLKLEQLTQGLHAIEELESSTPRILLELTVRWVDELQCQGITSLNISKVDISAGETITIQMPYFEPKENVRKAIERSAKKFFESRCAWEMQSQFLGTCNPHGGEIHANWDGGTFRLEFSK
ncbi:MAG: hypothetical protein AAB853_03280, partial [Patescibacteria group bacterium]